MKTFLHRPETGLPYAVMSPVADPERLPVLVFLHGEGERGDDPELATTVGLGPAMRAHRHDWPVVAIFPQCPPGETWTGDVLVGILTALERARADYDCRAGPVALTGIGMGGTGVWEAASRWPHRWSRIMPVAAPRIEDGLLRARTVPMWVHHGAEDQVVPVSEARVAVRRMAVSAAPHLRYDERPGAGHQIWDEVYGSLEVARWLSEAFKRPMEGPAVGTVFIGGTGRSGTTTMSSIIVRHPDFARTPEIRIHGRPGGLFDVLAGETTPEDLVARARASWFYRWQPGGPPVGMHRMVDERRWDEVLSRYLGGFAADPYRVTAELMRTVLDPIAIDAEATSWVEHSPLNGRQAHILIRLFPDLKMIHTIRDGRDTAVSMTHQTWGPDNAEDGVREWAQRLRDTWRSTRAVPPGQVLEVRWEELIATDREAQLARVLEFLEVEESRAMRYFFDNHVNPAKAHSGRWRTELPPAEADRVDKLYRELLDELRDEGVGCLPVPPD